MSTLAQAQADLDRWATGVSDRRRRGQGTVGALADSEPLAGLPASPFPAQLEAERVVSRTALVAFQGNHYSVEPGLVGQTVTVRARLGEVSLDLVSQAGRLLARHRRAPAGAAQTVRSAEHAAELERAVLEAFTTRKPCRAKQNRPPGEAALAQAALLHGRDDGGAVVVDLEQYAQIASANAGGDR